MAQHQLTFDFILNAAMNGSFSSAFSKAVQEFKRLGDEIKNLQALQHDVSAYQKQEAAVQNTSARLENLKHQYELVNRQISETTGSTTILEWKKLKLEQRIINTSEALERQKQTLEATKGRLDEAGISADNLAGEEEKLKTKIQELAREQEEAAKRAEEFQNAGVAAISAVADVITAVGLAGAIREVRDAFSDCVRTAADFEQAMSAVEAIADASRDEMTALTEEAKAIGAATVYTAQQSADAMSYMAMAGWNAQEMLDGMRGMTTLAAAAGEDLARVSDIVTDNLTAFGLSASDTAHFADVLASAAANSNTNISIMGETFKSSSAVAGALGYTIEDMAVAVGLMANSAVKGSRASTALRNIFDGLLKGVTLTSKAFGEVKYSVINTDGSMKGFIETVRDLRGYFSQMTGAEQVGNAMAIAGMRGYNGLLAILRATDEDFQSLYDSINNCAGAAERMAAVKLDNLNGDIALADSAMEALKSTVGDEFNPELRAMTQYKTELLNGLNDFIKANPALTKGVMAGTAAFLGLSGAIVGLNSAIKVFQALNLASPFTGAVGPVLALAGAAAVATGVFVGVRQSIKDSLDESWELTASAREQQRRIEELNSEYEEAKQLYGENSYEAQKLQWSIEALSGEYEAGRQTFEDYRAAHEAVMKSYQNVAEAREKSNTSIQNEQEGVSALIAQLGILAGASEEAAQRQGEIQAIVDRLNNTLPGLELNIEDVADGSVDFVSSLEQAAQEQADTRRLEQEYQNYADAIEQRGILQGKIKDATEQLRIATEEYQAALGKYEEAGLRRQDDEDGLGKFLNAKSERAELDAAREQMKTYQAILEELNAAFADNEAAIFRSGEIMAEYIGKLTEIRAATGELGEVFDGALDGTLGSLEKLAEKYTEAYEAAKESFSGQFGLFDKAKADTEATVQAAQTALDTQLAYWESYADNLAALQKWSAEDLGITQENYEALIGYVRTGTPEAVGLIQNMVEELGKGNTQVVTDLANTLGEVREMQSTAAEETATWTTGLKEQVDQLVADVGDDVGQLHMEPEAAAAARATLESYIGQANNMLPQVKAAYARVADAAISALNQSLAHSTLSIPSAGSLSRIMRPSTTKTNGYATGTDNAPPGWAWVGEDGPELMRMRGGEQILPHSVSREVTRIYNRYDTGHQVYSSESAIYAANSRDESERYRNTVQEEVKLYNIYNSYHATESERVYSPESVIHAPNGRDENERSVCNAGYAPEVINAPSETIRENTIMRIQAAKQIPQADIYPEIIRTQNVYQYYNADNKESVTGDLRGVRNVQERQIPELKAVTVGDSGGSGSIGKIEIHLHIEAGASVNAWTDYARRGELESVILGVMERAQAQAKRRAMV